MVVQRCLEQLSTWRKTAVCNYCQFGAVSQAAYAAYSAIATQAATVVGAMDKVWSGGGGPEGYNGSGHGAADVQSGMANAQQQQARLAVALQSTDDSDDVYVQVR